MSTTNTTPTKHTPGPWHQGNTGIAYIIYDIEGYAIANAQTFHGRHREGEAVANARLIAAAPDMYEALWAMLRAHEGKMAYGAAEAARAALAKATGTEGAQ